MKQPNISIIIPIYNMKEYLSDCIDSVAEQSLRNIEIICVDDGSTDDSGTILNAYAEKDERIKVITQDNRGVAVARNNGIDNARGEYLFFIDPDDWLPDDKVLEDLYTTAKDNNVLICGGSVIYSTPYGVVEEWTDPDVKNTFKEDCLVRYSDYQYDFGWVRYIYNREFLNSKNFRIPELSFYEDPVFFVQVLSEAQQFYALRRATYCYRTGYKELIMTYQKVNDLLEGIYNIICLAKENQYEELVKLEKKRIVIDFAEYIYPHLLDDGPSSIKNMVDKINYQLNGGFDRIEYKLFDSIIRINKEKTLIAAHEEAELEVKQARLEKQREVETMIQNLRREAQRETEIAVQNARIEAAAEREKACLERKQAVQDAEQQTMEMMYNSTTWKVGNTALIIPKKIKQIVKKTDK